MARIVCVHGIAQQFGAAPALERAWVDGIRGGLEISGLSRGEVEELLSPDDVRVAFYGDEFREQGTFLAMDHAGPANEGDLDEFEEQLVLEWWKAAKRNDPNGVFGPDDPTLWHNPAVVQHALAALVGIPFFAGMSEALMRWDLRQVRRYFGENDLRQRIRRRVQDEITPDTQVVIGHSLGSVVAYEALCALRSSTPRALLTLGSPLGVRNLVFDRLVPRPADEPDGRGQWPGEHVAWTNVIDKGDVVTLGQRLRPLFGPPDGFPAVTDVPIDNGSRAHDVSRYLTAKETGAAVAAALLATGGAPSS